MLFVSRYNNTIESMQLARAQSRRKVVLKLLAMNDDVHESTLITQLNDDFFLYFEYVCTAQVGGLVCLNADHSIEFFKINIASVCLSVNFIFYRGFCS
jgi:hypothetical protein